MFEYDEEYEFFSGHVVDTRDGIEPEVHRRLARIARQRRMSMNACIATRLGEIVS